MPATRTLTVPDRAGPGLDVLTLVRITAKRSSVAPVRATQQPMPIDDVQALRRPENRAGAKLP